MYEINVYNSVINYYYYYKNSSNTLVNDIIHIFSICSSTLYNWLNIYNNKKVFNGKILGRPKNTGIIIDEVQKYIVKLFISQKIHSMKNVKRSIRRIFQISIKKSSIYRILKINKITYKKISIDRVPYKKKDLKERKEKLRELLNIKKDIPVNNDNIISFDEAFLSPETLAKMYSWAKLGERAKFRKNGRKFKQGMTMMMAISNKKVVAYKLLKGSVNGEHVYDFLFNDVLKNDKNKIILMDNARTHHYKKIKARIEETNNKIVYNVPYSPQYNPIEYMNNIIKTNLKNRNIQDISSLSKELDKIMNKIPESYYLNCFNKAYEYISHD